jgi:D-mannonate dehydratase
MQIREICVAAASELLPRQFPGVLDILGRGAVCLDVMKLTRRHLLQIAGLTRTSFLLGQLTGSEPKLCMGMNWFQMSEARLAFMGRLGIRWVALWGPGAPTYSPEGRVIGRRGDPAPTQGPWQETQIREIKQRVEKAGLRVGIMMLHDYRDVILGRPGRDAAIERVQQSIRVAGRVGIPTVEYNFYALRAQAGYYRSPGRFGSTYSSYDYERCRELPVLPDVGEHPAEELWSRYTYFLKAVIPVAEEAGVVMAVHPNDPPAPIYRGVAQILASIEGLKRLVEIVPKPQNGITFDTGVNREWGHNPPEWIQYFGRRKQINHIHFRNVITEKPGLKYREVFINEGQVDMLACMKALYGVGYNRLVYPDHVPGIPGGDGGRNTAWAHVVGYIQGLMRVAAS